MVGSRALRTRARTVAERLALEYPGSAESLCALRHNGTFQLLVAPILSAQTTAERVNMVTPALFSQFPTPGALAAAPLERVEDIIRSTGFFRTKARNLVAMASGLVDRFGGEVPSTMDELTSLAGVGRKTANVVRSVGMALPGLPVDTHVGRLSRRLGLSAHADPVDVEGDLDALVEPDDRGTFSLRLILHGRAVCRARAPNCPECVLVDICPSALLPVLSAEASGEGHQAASRVSSATASATRGAGRPRRAR